jgi:hypothetical protein
MKDKSNKGSSKKYNKDTNSLDHCKDSLRKYLESRPYINQIEYPEICKKFGLPYLPSIFRQVYYKRIFQLIIDNGPLTMATVSKITKIPQKYGCYVKRNLEKNGYVKVYELGQCPTTGSHGVQFITATKKANNYE